MKIYIGIPTYDRRVDMELLMLYGNLAKQKKYDINIQFTSSPIITKSRNRIAADFLKNKYDWLLFIDSDLVIHDYDFLDLFFETAYKLDAQIVGGCYRTKNNSFKYPIAIGDYEREWKNFSVGELKEPRLVDYIGNGLMMIQKIVLQTILQPIFEMQDITADLTIPEDWVFCQKARKAEFKIAIDPRIKTTHYGHYGWEHNIYD